MMRSFLKHIIFFSVLVLLFFTMLLKNYGGYLDYFYEKFTTPRQYSLILGDSRAMQGIQPKVLDSCLRDGDYKLPTYNFSFTIAQAAYGPSYLSAIKRKLDTTVSNQLFIVTVNPWMLANREPNLDIENDDLFADTPPHNMMLMNMSPNFEYVIKNFNYFHFKAIFRKNSKLHEDGWLEENNLPKTNKVFAEWKANQVEMFNNWSNEWGISAYRLKWLSKTIEYLKKYGEVVIVRTPIDNEILHIENNFWKNFNQAISEISIKKSVLNLNFTNDDNWSTYDGHHLDKFGGKLFSIELSKQIKEK